MRWAVGLSGLSSEWKGSSLQFYECLGRLRGLGGWWMAAGVGRLLVVAAIAAVAAGCGGAGRPTSLPISDDFSDCSVGWSTDSDAYVSLGCASGAYRLLIKDPQIPQNARMFLAKGVRSLEIESDATRHAGPTQLGTKNFLVYGMGCWATPKRGYLFLVSPDGSWSIAKILVGGSHLFTDLTSSTKRTAIRGFTRTSRL